MAEYTKVFENPYPDGWKNLPNEETPITADALQEHTDAIENIEQYLADNPISGGGGSSADVKYYERNGFLSKNLLNPTMETTTIGELTCRNNGDGTYTLKGEYNGGEEFILQTDIEILALQPYRLVGCPSNITSIYLALDTYVDNGSGKDFAINVPIKLTLKIVVPQGSMGILANDGLTFTPMLSHDLNTTKSDFMPYAPSNIDLQKQIDQGGGGSTSYYGTSAEFEEFKKRTDILDGTEYNVTDDYSEGGSSKEIYSLEEVLIGKFLGKNLYRKVFRTTESVTSTNKEYTQINLTGVEWLVNCHVIVEHSDNTWFIPFQAKNQNNHIYGKGISGDTPDSGYYTDFILEYTKVGD